MTAVDAPNPATKAPPARETLVRLPELGSEGERALVEVMARAIAGEQVPSGMIAYAKRGWVERHQRLYRDHATAALSALRGQLEREGRR